VPSALAVVAILLGAATWSVWVLPRAAWLPPPADSSWPYPSR
jgi:hypothetical protein